MFARDGSFCRSGYTQGFTDLVLMISHEFSVVISFLPVIQGGGNAIPHAGSCRAPAGQSGHYHLAANRLAIGRTHRLLRRQAVVPKPDA